MVATKHIEIGKISEYYCAGGVTQVRTNFSLKKGDKITVKFKKRGDYSIKLFLSYP
jgi:hypothetical protein